MSTDLKKELEKMYEEDQKYKSPEAREKLKNMDWDSYEGRKIQEEDRATGLRLLKRLEEICSESGWPTISQVGTKAALAAWLIIQHAEDLAIQERYLPLLVDLAKKGEVKPSLAALLQDRVLVRNGKNQIFGSQITTDEDTGEACPYPIEDKEGVDQRRSEVGLEPLAEYLKYFQ